MNSIFYLIAILFILSGCTNDEPQTIAPRHCIDCHTVHPDTSHQQSCISCHKGNSPANDKESAHLGYIPLPAHPDHLAESCGACHEQIVERITGSEHFTLYSSTNLFRRAFGAENNIAGFLHTPQKSIPETELELADDLLRRNCFRCHPYNSGDAYPAVSHGTGCASCHMAFIEGKLVSHSLQKPGDAQCLSCHYGNYVGFDYYGRFEHDLNIEYRTPFTTNNQHFRPYGVEYHQLQPDIHQVRGMLCIDCHSGQELMGTGKEKPSCAGCHRQEELQTSLPPLVEKRDGLFILRGRNGKDHPIPLLNHPAHAGQTGKISCQACHAQWTFNDFGKHFLRSDTDDFEEWANLSVQGNWEIEKVIDNNVDFDNPELPAQMTDKLTGEPEIGLWHKGFTMRRWETPILGRDDKGVITTVRPILDYFLSWVDEEGAVQFDSVQSTAAHMGMRPYVPHTTGPAGIFYKERIAQFLTQERSSTMQADSSEQPNDR